MLLSNFLIQLSTQSGIVDDARLLAITNLAAIEVWNHSDFPGSLFEETFITTQEAYITLPWYVQKVRMAKGSDKVPIRLNSPHTAYLDSTWWQSPWTWRRVKKGPTHTNIITAGPVTVRRTTSEALEVQVVLVGKTNQAAEVYETVTLASGVKSAVSINGFSELTHIEKNVRTGCDIAIYDQRGTEISKIPNHLLSVQYQVIQIHDKCSNFYPCCIGGATSVDILFKKHFQGWPTSDGIVDNAMYPTLLWKALEISRINPDAPIELLSTKAATAYLDAGSDSTLGDELQYNSPRSIFNRAYSGYL